MKQGKDPFFLYKKKRHDNPKLKFRISLGIKDKPYISVLDPEMIKQLFQNEANYEKLNNFLFMDHKNKHSNYIFFVIINKIIFYIFYSKF